MKKIQLSEQTVFGSERQYEEILDGFTAVHRKSGVVTQGHKKSLLPTRPYKKDGKTYVVFTELCRALDRDYKAAVKELPKNFGEKSVNEELHIPLEDYAEKILKKKVYSDEKMINGGMFVFGEKEFQPPEHVDWHLRILVPPHDQDEPFVPPPLPDELQDFNNYLFFLRPGEKDILSAYEASPVKGQHPRLQATKEDFDRIRSEVKTNSLKRKWAEQIINDAEAVFEKEPVIYELRDGIRLLLVSRQVLAHMYTLGMAYQLTGDKRYADRAYLDLEAVAAFPDWHPQHDIDTCEMTAGAAIGYDWMYDAFSPEQRAVIEKGIYENAFRPYALAYKTKNNPMRSCVNGQGNHTMIASGGITLAALAMLDVYPEESLWFMKNAIRGIETVLHLFAPEGAYYEGPHYWELGMQFTAKMLSSMQTVLQTDFTLGMSEGLSDTSQWLLHMSTPNGGVFNISDGVEAKQYVPELIFLGNYYNNPGITTAVIEATDGELKNAEDRALGLIWLRQHGEKGNLELDHCYESMHTVCMRDTWQGKEPTYAAIHAGTEWDGCHSHLDGGGFIFDSMGVRWAIELGYGPINHPCFWRADQHGARWSLYRNRAEAHNTIVINPCQKPDHHVDAYAPITRFESGKDGALTVVNMTDLMRFHTRLAKRAMMLTEQRKCLVIRDEINTFEEADVYWFMQTRADVEISGNRAVLSQQGKTLILEYVSNVEGLLEVTRSEPLPESPHVENDMVETANRIKIKLRGKGDINITVKLFPADFNGKSVDGYDIPIAKWKTDRKEENNG